MQSSKSSKKRELIIETATYLFSHYGYHAVGVERIIAETRVSKMTMYRHFESKERLIVEVLERQLKMMSQEFDQVVGTDCSSVVKIKSIFDWFDAWVRGPQFSGCMFIHASSEFSSDEGTIKEVVKKQKNKFISVFESILIADNLKKNVANKLARHLVMLIDGALVSREITGDVNTIREAWGIGKNLLDVSIAASAKYKEAG